MSGGARLLTGAGPVPGGIALPSEDRRAAEAEGPDAAAVLDVAAELAAEAAWLGARLGHPTVRARGAAGVLNPVVRSAVWVHGPAVSVDALVAELRGCAVVPDVMVLEGLPADLGGLAAAGWRPVAAAQQVRHDAPHLLGLPAPRLRAAGVAVRRVGVRDLARVRDLVDEAFGTTDAAAHLPDGVLDVPDLRLLVATGPGDEALGTVGVRLRHAGALVFGLGVGLDARRAGVASRLVSACGAWAASRGAGYVIADTELEHAPLWGGLGFRATARWHRWSAS